MATSLTARDILTMTSDDLRKYVSDFGQDPKNMTKTDMQTWLFDRAPPSEPASPLEMTGMPSFVSKLTPELQLQYYLKKEEREKELEITKLRLEAEERDRVREAELTLELKRLEVSQAQNVTVVGAAPAFRLENAIKLLPKFNEQNVEEYLIGFEKVAEINNWPQDCYALCFILCFCYCYVLHAMLVGKGLKVFAELSTEDCKYYSKLKAALLNAYPVVSEVYSSRFRNRMKQPTET